MSELMTDEHNLAVDTLVRREDAGLQFHGWQTFAEQTVFEQQFEGPARHRRAILAIVGPSNSGKSLLARDILQRLATSMGLPGFHEITVENHEELDLRDFRVNRHNGVLLDGVGDVQTLRKHRETLQGRPKVVLGGRSATMMYAYKYTLCRRAVIATFDLSAANLHMLTTDHWLKQRENVIVLRLAGPAWTGGRIAEAQQSKEDELKSWSVKEVANFLRCADLDGPAATCEANGVSGQDLFELTVERLCADVRLTRFAAQKVVSARLAVVSGS